VPFLINRRWVRGITLKILYPLLIFAGSFLKNKKESFQKFIISLNNKLVKKERSHTKKILLLLPHCLQIKDLIQIADENHLELFVATGGSLARRIINEIKPEAVVAIACENDLSSGIVDTYPLPILGITNERPFGPCLNTRVDLAKVKEAIEFFGKTN
jgi:hypothetical protein